MQARKDAVSFAANRLETLSDKTKTPTSQLKFIMDAWGQVRTMRCMPGSLQPLSALHWPALAAFASILVKRLVERDVYCDGAR